MTSAELLLLDACGCINLAAAFPLKTLEENLGRPIRMLEQAAAESLFLHQYIDGELVRVPIDVGVIATLALEDGPEVESYVRLARRLGDGEAASLAVSHHRELEFVTDDRAARRIAGSEAPNARILGTAGLLKSLTDTMALSKDELALAILRVESQASFRPPNDDPEFTWWNASREPGG